MKILFCINILFALLNAIASDADFFNNMSPEERRSFFETDDGSIPAYDIVQMALPSRAKRANEPINMSFNVSGNSVTVTLEPIQDDDLISRGITGIWDAVRKREAFQNVQYTPRPALLEELGDIEFFQNLEDASAVTRFRDAHGNETILGIIRHQYVVKSIPKESESGSIGGEHVIAQRSIDPMNDQDGVRLSLAVFESEKIVRRAVSAKNEILDDALLHRAKRQTLVWPGVVYPKLLIVVQAALIRRYESEGEFLMRLIAQLHVVNVMFRQLDDPQVRFRIVGIILPFDDKATPYIKKHIRPTGEIDSTAIFDVKEHFRNEDFRFPFDKWNSVAVLTADALVRNDGGTEVSITGNSPVGEGCEHAALIATYNQNLGGALTLAHELGHMFGAGHDGMPDENGDYNVMAAGHGASRKPTWSTASQNAILTYLRERVHYGFCSHLREDEIPDEFRSSPGVWLPIRGQCDNLYKDTEDTCSFPSADTGCTIFACRLNGTECSQIVKSPLEGTYLDINNRTTVACKFRSG